MTAYAFDTTGCLKMRAFRAVGIATFLVALGLTSIPSSARAADVRRWSFEATVVHMDDDLEGEFGDVRLGDPVTGLFTYDLDAKAEFREPGLIAGYGHPSTFAGIRVAIDNPRTETELRWEPHRDFYIQVHTDAHPFFEQSALLVSQVATPPLPDWEEYVMLQFLGTNVQGEESLPLELRLDDWEAADVLFFADSGATIWAQIHTLLPVEIVEDCDGSGLLDRADLACLHWSVDPTASRDSVLTSIGSLPGDLDGDGSVAFADFLTLARNYGLAMDVSYGDGDVDLNGNVQFPDFIILASNFGNSAEVRAVPEPGTRVLLLFGAAGFVRRRIRRKGDAPGPCREVQRNDDASLAWQSAKREFVRFQDAVAPKDKWEFDEYIASTQERLQSLEGKSVTP